MPQQKTHFFRHTAVGVLSWRPDQDIVIEGALLNMFMNISSGGDEQHEVIIGLSDPVVASTLSQGDNMIADLGVATDFSSAVSNVPIHGSLYISNLAIEMLAGESLYSRFQSHVGTAASPKVTVVIYYRVGR